MLFNWGRATLGTIPFVTLGAALERPRRRHDRARPGAAIFGLGGVAVAYGIVGRLAREMKAESRGTR